MLICSGLGAIVHFLYAYSLHSLTDLKMQFHSEGWTSAECISRQEQIFQNLRQEYSRIQRRRQLEGAFNQTEACSSSSTLNAPSSPPGASKKDQPSFTLRQVSYLCERLLKDHEEKIREEYEQILNTKLAEQYESFVKFTQDQIMRRYGARPASYVS
ncbi:transcript variant X2 [Nothobranchius furzeri]|uniref:Transcript variant X2 n=1 Tax=Nothobranchius furzeri TaxID=105023 RepID=A0A9D2YUA8_NOTFU|nr:transcript variant X2 [Nothobranchius furzeri]